MNEVNEAAKVVTESADQNAVIIFGAIIDPNMKDELKVTVVATGFDGHNGEKNVFASGVGAKKDFFKKDEYKEEFDTPAEWRSKKIEVEKADKTVEAKSKEEDDESEIPAFIRKKMGE